jgi:prepilin-type N-terminal cleavage/methylation domain-containing protein
MGTNTMRKQQGFTLIEIAIVLVIIGLLLGGVLKGQELINAARVRNIVSQLDGVKIAYLGFQDRYRAYPGDIPTAQAATLIPGSATVGCVTAPTCGNGRIDPNENLLVWYHLSRSNFISGSYTGVTDTGTVFQPPTSADSPANPYGGFLMLANDNDYGDVNATTNAVLNVKTGGIMPVAVVAEIDRKVDDGQPGTGTFRIGIAYGGVNPAVGSCLAGAANNTAGMLYNASQDIKACGGVAIQ